MNVLYLFMPVHPKCNTLGMRAMPPLAVYYLATILKENGIEVDVVDPDIVTKSKYFINDEEAIMFVQSLVETKHYEAVLFSSTTGNWGVTKGMIEKIHSLYPVMPICVGGIHASYFANYIVETMPYVVVLKGEGERNLVQLLRYIEEHRNYDDVPGIAYFADNIVVQNPNEPLLAIDELQRINKVEYETAPENCYDYFGLETSRGCRFNCIFCSVCYRKIWRGYSEEFVVDSILCQVDIIKSKTRSGLPKIYLVDDCFTMDTQRALNILEKLYKKRKDLRISFEARVTDLIKPGFVESMPKNIIENIQIGVEAGYNAGLRKVRKGITVEQLEKCAELLSDMGLQDRSFFSFIIGFPWETISEIKKTISTIAYLCETYSIQANLNWLWVMPSDLWMHREEYKIDVDESVFDDPLWIVNRECFMRTHPTVTADDILEVHKLINFYLEKGVLFGFAGIMFED